VRIYVSSVFVGLPDVLKCGAAGRAKIGRLVDRAARRARRVRRLAHLRLAIPPHCDHNTASKDERGNSVIADVLRSFAGERVDAWPDFVLLVKFVIESESPSTTPHRGLARGTRPSTPTAGPRPAPSSPPRLRPAAPEPAGSVEAVADLMGRVTTEVRAEWQDRRKAELDAHAVALTALATMDGPLQGACVPGAQELPQARLRRPRDVARLPRIQRRMSALVPAPAARVRRS
jgi:hypothetical protein